MPLEELRKIRGSQGMGNVGEREGGGRGWGRGRQRASLHVGTMGAGGRFLAQLGLSGQIVSIINRVSLYLEGGD